MLGLKSARPVHNFVMRVVLLLAILGLSLSASATNALWKVVVFYTPPGTTASTSKQVTASTTIEKAPGSHVSARAYRDPGLTGDVEYVLLNGATGRTTSALEDAPSHYFYGAIPTSGPDADLFFRVDPRGTPGFTNSLIRVSIVSTDPEADNYEVYGYVKDEQGFPIRGAEVNITEDGSVYPIGASVDTDQYGMYWFRGVVRVSGQYRCHVRKDGYEADHTPGFWVDLSRSAGRTRAPDVNLLSDQETFTVSGVVSDADAATPLSQARVRISSSRGSVTRYSNSNGEYEFAELVGGIAYTITASASGYSSGSARISNLDSNTSIDLDLESLQETYDLKPTSVSHSMAPAGDSIHVEVVVENTGLADLRRSVSIGAYASDNDTPSVVGEPNQLGSITTDGTAIPAGDSRTF